MDLVETPRVLDTGVQPNRAAKVAPGAGGTITTPPFEAPARPQQSEVDDGLGPVRGIATGVAAGSAVWLCLIYGAVSLFARFTG